MNALIPRGVPFLPALSAPSFLHYLRHIQRVQEFQADCSACSRWSGRRVIRAGRIVAIIRTRSLCRIGARCGSIRRITRTRGRNRLTRTANHPIGRRFQSRIAGLTSVVGATAVVRTTLRDLKMSFCKQIPIGRIGRLRARTTSRNLIGLKRFDQFWRHQDQSSTSWLNFSRCEQGANRAAR